MDYEIKRIGNFDNRVLMSLFLIKMIRLIFDCLRSPYDFANIIQVALALNNCEIYITGDSLNHKHPKIFGKVASWSSNIKKHGFPDSLKIYYFDSLEFCVDKLREEGIQLIGTSPHAKKSFYDLDLSGDEKVLVFGTEVGGLSRRKMALMDEIIKVPMSGNIDFMTLSVAAPIVAYEISRQQREFIRASK